MRKDGVWHAKVGTQPWGAVVLDQRFKLEALARTRFKRHGAGEKWQQARVETFNPADRSIKLSLL